MDIVVVINYLNINENPYRFLTQISRDIFNICYVKTISEVTQSDACNCSEHRKKITDIYRNTGEKLVETNGET